MNPSGFFECLPTAPSLQIETAKALICSRVVELWVARYAVERGVEVERVKALLRDDIVKVLGGKMSKE